MESKHSDPNAPPLAQERYVVNVRTSHHETPTVNSWKAFVAQRKALYAAQLKALKRK